MGSSTDCKNSPNVRQQTFQKITTPKTCSPWADHVGGSRWDYERGVELAFSRPGKPTDNANVESFHGRLRQECLNATWFMSLEDAKGKIAAWREYYNESRPHSALDWAAPAEFARRWWQLPASANSEKAETSTSERY